MTKHLGIEGIDPGEIGQIGQKHRGANHLSRRAPGLGQHGLKIGQHLAGFGLDIASADHVAGGRVQGNLT